MADERVETAVSHWAARLIANGVDYNDFVRTTSSITRWAQWLDAWTQTAEVHAALADRALAEGRQRTAGEAYLRAAISYHFSKFVWVLDPERNRQNTRAAIRALYAAHELLDPTAERIEAPLGHAHVVANLRRPRATGPAPLVVLIPGLDSTKEEFFVWESVFLCRGMATLSLDGPGQGEAGFELNIRSDYEVAVAAILDAVGDREDLDHTRIGAAGVSLGGHYVVRAAAFEPRLKAIASISGPYQFAAELGRPSIADARGDRAPHRRDRRRRRATPRPEARPHRGRRARTTAVPGRHRRPRSSDLLAADAADRGRRPGRRVGSVRGRHPRLQQHPVQVPPARVRLDARAIAMSGPIGAPLLRREDPPMVRGEACYVDDIERPEMVYAAFVRSHHAHAGIRSIRMSGHAPGLLSVITARDLRDRVAPFPISAPAGVELADEPHPVLPDDEVRYVGQPVAAVIATSRELAADAVELVEVDYEPREPVLDPGFSDRELTRWSRSSGDVEAAFAGAAHVVRRRYALPRLVAAPIEPRGVVVEHDAGTDRLTVWCSMQDPHRPLAQLGRILGRDQDRIHVIVPDVGGAFGSKGVIPAEAVVAAVAAIDLGRPVKWIEDRTENFLAAYQGRGIEGELELALDGEGRMLALRAALTADLGAYLFSTTAIPPHTAAVLLTGCYDIPAASVTVVGKRTNKVPTGPYRGAGRPDAAYLIERLVDDAARQVGIGRIELRRRNLIRHFPHETPLGLSYDSGDYERCLDTALELLGSDRAAGTGVALYVERAAGQWESATIGIAPDGQVSIASSASPHGQGHDITFAQIAADRLGVAVDRIVLRFGDSETVPPGVGTFGSRSTAVAGSAIALAADELVGQARMVAAELLGCEDVEFADGLFSAGDRALGWNDLAPHGLRASARFDSELVFSSGAYAAAVEVDRATGKLAVIHVVAVDDAGTIINPLLARGQVVGGAVQALGECLIEEAVYDEDGQLRTATFLDYGLLTAADVPEIVTAEVVSPSPRNPLGAKGVGEAGAIGTLAAVANAVADALGGVHLDPPYGSEKVWRALTERALG